MTVEPKYPDVQVTLVGEDGNAFAIIARVTKALKAAGEREAAAEFQQAAMRSDSYDALLQLCMEWVDCTSTMTVTISNDLLDALDEEMEEAWNE